MSLYIVVEGHGEDAAIRNLVTRLATHDHLVLPPSVRVQRRQVRWNSQLTTACESVRRRDGVSGLLLTPDADAGDDDDADGHDCPKIRAPEAARWIGELALPFPAAIVMFRWEYESMFLSALDKIAGRPLKGDDGIERPGVLAGAAFHGDPDQAPRGAKEWLTRNMPPGVAYKPTADQLAMTRLLDPAHPKLNNLPSFRRLRRAVAFLASNVGHAGAVYPGTVEAGDG